MVENEILIFSNDLFFWKKINLSAITQVSSAGIDWDSGTDLSSVVI